MQATERRIKIQTLLMQAEQPISATSLAREFEVSRQIIVGDIALLRAGNVAISATPRGYVMQVEQDAVPLRTIACRHTREQLAQELYTVVDHGCGLVDVIVEHGVYGQISGQLHIFSRYDADLFMEKLDRENAAPLSALTDGVHLHTISCPSTAAYHRILAELTEKGILFDR